MRSPTGLPLGPTLPDLRARMNRSQSLCESVDGHVGPFRRTSETSSSRPGRAVGCALPFAGRHLFTVDVKKRLQGEWGWAGLAVRPGSLAPAPWPRAAISSACLLGPSPVAMPERLAPPAALLPPLDLDQAGFGIGKDPNPVPAPFAGAVAPPAAFRACHHPLPLGLMDCTICPLETSPSEGFTARPTWHGRSTSQGSTGGPSSSGALITLS